MSKIVSRIGNFFLDNAAKLYMRSMTRKLNAFGEHKSFLRATTVRRSQAQEPRFSINGVSCLSSSSAQY